MRQRKSGFAFTFFYLLFSRATWQVIIGGLVTLLIAPYIIDEGTGLAGEVVLSLMLLVCAAWLAAYPAGKIASALQNFFTVHKTM